MTALVALLQESRTQHWGGGERDQHRNRDRDAQRDCKFAEELADDPAHQQDGDEDGNQRRAHREHGESDFLRALHRSFVGLHALFEIAGDVLDDYDGVVDHETGGDGERHQREVVDGVAEQVHHSECAHQRKRHGDGGNDGRPYFAEEKKDDEHHQDDADDQRNFNIANAGANRGGAVDRDTHLDGGRDCGLQARHLLAARRRRYR